MALAIPPAKSTWLSFSKIMSNRPMRWLQPPPIFTASFSSMRRPGVVLRVSSTRVCVPSRRFTYSAVRVATPLMRCIMFSIKRSVCSSDCTRPSTTKAMSPRFTRSPSCSSCVIFRSGSKAWNMRFATSTPASTPSSLMMSCCLPRASAGMHERVVWSPSPMSSANQSLICSSRLSIICLVYSELLY